MSDVLREAQKAYGMARAACSTAAKGANQARRAACDWLRAFSEEFIECRGCTSRLHVGALRALNPSANALSMLPLCPVCRGLLCPPEMAQAIVEAEVTCGQAAEVLKQADVVLHRAQHAEDY